MFQSPLLFLHRTKSFNLLDTNHKIIKLSLQDIGDLISLSSFVLPNESLPSSPRSCFNEPKSRISHFSFKACLVVSQQRLLRNRVWSKGSLPPLFPSDRLKHTAGPLGNSETLKHDQAQMSVWTKVHVYVFTSSWNLTAWLVKYNTGDPKCWAVKTYKWFLIMKAPYAKCSFTCPPLPPHQTDVCSRCNEIAFIFNCFWDNTWPLTFNLRNHHNYPGCERMWRRMKITKSSKVLL